MAHRTRMTQPPIFTNGQELVKTFQKKIFHEIGLGGSDPGGRVLGGRTAQTPGSLPPKPRFSPAIVFCLACPVRCWVYGILFFGLGENGAAKVG